MSTAVRLCDGCIILVDVIEGLCSQTRTALQLAWLSRVRPFLMLNKIDRLFTERKLEPLDIYIHLVQTLEQINAFVGELFASEVLSKTSFESNNSLSNTADSIPNEQNRKQIFYDWSSGLDDADDSGVYFSPENNNVIFASAIDGWGFTIADFARILSKSKYGFSENVLNKTLWGDYYLNTKEKRIQKGAQLKAKKTLFVTLVLENLSKVYEKFVLKRDKNEMAKIAQSLGVNLTSRDLNHTDPKTALTQLFSQWMPLSNSVLQAICDIVPCPAEINEERVVRIMCANDTLCFESLPYETRVLKNAFLSCKSDSVNDTDQTRVPLIVCVSKMFSFERSSLPQYRHKPLTIEEINLRREKFKEEKQNIPLVEEPVQPEIIEENNTVFIGFARVFSGTLRRNDWVYVLGPKHDPNKVTKEYLDDINCSTRTLADLSSDQHITRAQIKDLYLLMGRDLDSVEEVHAGHICGIGGLELHVIKSATLSSSPYCPPFVDNFFNTIPILRVAVETQNPSDMPILIHALKTLNQVDPCVEVKIQETGEHVIIATGEVHLERCVVDLKSFIGEEIEINISEPIVPFRETISDPPKVDMLNESITDQKIMVTNINKKFASLMNSGENDKQTESLPQGLIEQMTPNKKFSIKIRAKPLPESVTQTLDSNQDIIKKLLQFQCKNVMHNTNINYVTDSSNLFTADMINNAHELRVKLENQFTEAGWPADTVDHIWSMGPKFNGPNLLINQITDFIHRPCFLPKSGQTKVTEPATCQPSDERYQLENSFVNGFQLCTQAGPLCDEPMMGVCFTVEQWTCSTDEPNTEQNVTSNPFGPISGQIMSTVKDCCLRSFQAQPQRLMAAMFSCVIQINSDVLGK